METPCAHSHLQGTKRGVFLCARRPQGHPSRNARRDDAVHPCGRRVAASGNAGVGGGPHDLMTAANFRRTEVCRATEWGYTCAGSSLPLHTTVPAVQRLDESALDIPCAMQVAKTRHAASGSSTAGGGSNSVISGSCRCKLVLPAAAPADAPSASCSQ